MLLYCWCVYSAGRRVFLFSCDKLGTGLYENTVSSKAVPEVLDMKYRSEFKHGFTDRGYLHCATLITLHGFQEKRAHRSKHMLFFLQNVPNEIFKIFKMFENNMKFTRAACWINSKISNRDKNTTLIIFLFCHSCLLLSWYNYWKSLKLDSLLQKTFLDLLQWKPIKNNEKCFLFHLKNSSCFQDI